MHQSKELTPVVTHAHTVESDGFVTVRNLVAEVDKEQQRLDRPIILALTNHDTIKGLSEAARITQCRGIQLIAGQEISVGRWPNKHLLAYWREEPSVRIPHGRSPEWTIDAVK